MKTEFSMVIFEEYASISVSELWSDVLSRQTFSLMEAGMRDYPTLGWPNFSKM